jgi:hypothetical protein
MQEGEMNYTQKVELNCTQKEPGQRPVWLTRKPLRENMMVRWWKCIVINEKQWQYFDRLENIDHDSLENMRLMLENTEKGGGESVFELSIKIFNFSFTEKS